MEASTRLWRRSARSPLIDASVSVFYRSEEFIHQMEELALRHRAQFLLEGGKGPAYATHMFNWKPHSPLGTLYEVRENICRVNISLLE